jgi:hypothetical protein
MHIPARTRVAAVVLAVGASLVPASASHAAPAAVEAAGHYDISSGAGVYQVASIPLISTFVDDAVFRLSTTTAGAQHLPFPIKVYNRTFSAMWVSSNGNVQFGTAASTAWSNECLPATALTRPFIAPYWDDWQFDPTAIPTQGIYVKTTGTAPHRKFIVSWRGTAFAGADQPRRAEIIFSEGSASFITQYADGDTRSSTIGAQLSVTNFSQRSCNPPTQLQPGTKLTWTRRIP